MQSLLLAMRNFMLEVGIGGTIDSEKWNFLQPIVNALKELINPMLILVATAGAIYAIYLGVVMAKAEDQGKRDEAKKKVINAVLALVAIIILILMLKLFVQNFHNLTGIEG